MKETNDIIIKMKKDGSVSQGPCYSIEIFKSGKIVYEGISGVKNTGIQVSYLSQDLINGLLREIRNLYFFDLKDRYKSTDRNAPVISLSVKLNTSTKTVEFTHSPGVPSGLLRLEAKIDSTTQSIRWTGSS
jgi:Domain of unknown function (DUF6438)